MSKMASIYEEKMEKPRVNRHYVILGHCPPPYKDSKVLTGLSKMVTFLGRFKIKTNDLCSMERNILIFQFEQKMYNSTKKY